MTDLTAKWTEAHDRIVWDFLEGIVGDATIADNSMVLEGNLQNAIPLDYP
jgi:hypothetical protein